MDGSLRLLAKLTLAVVALLVFGLPADVPVASAQSAPEGFNVIEPPEPQAGSFGIEATKVQPPPLQAATITVPGSGSSFSNSPITVSGICQTGLLVQVYNNGVMAGAVMCEGGSFSLQVSLFAGTNELTAIVYDDLEQVGPVSNLATVEYTDTSFQAFGELVTLTSNYGRRSAPAGGQLQWPLQLAGGSGPYAFSIDWGDGSETQLLSHSIAGLVDLAHSYSRAGIYQVNIRVVDSNGISAFLQLIAVSSGQVDPADKVEDDVPTKIEYRIVWWPIIVVLILLIPVFWLGGRSKLFALRKRMIKERDSYQEK